VTDFTLDDLQQLYLNQERSDRDQSFNGKYKIPTFEEYVRVAKDHGVKIYPETKTPAFFYDLTGARMENLLIDELKRLDFPTGLTIVQSFSDDSLRRVSSLDEDIPLVLLTKTPLTDEQLDDLRNEGAYGIGPSKDLIISNDGNGYRTGVTDLADRAHR